MNKLILVISLFFLSCGNKQSDEETSKLNKTKTNQTSTGFDFVTSLDNEKLALIAIMKNIPEDTLGLIMKDYIVATEDNWESIEKDFDYTKIVNSLSTKYKMKRTKIANIIFSYKYEMVTKDEIQENFRESIEETDIQYSENPDY